MNAGDGIIAYLGLGSNLGDREAKIEEAIGRISAGPGITFLRSSSVFETEPWGDRDQPDYLNCAVEIRTVIDVFELFAFVKNVERRMGRLPAPKNAPRIIDVDILLYGVLELQSAELIIPHARLAQRRFVLAPLDELIPDRHHPVLGSTIHELLATCFDMSRVRKFRPSASTFH